MVHSNLAETLIALLMYALQIVYKLWSNLSDSSAEHWIQQSCGLTVVKACTCHLYPSSFPRRHGHIFIPAWEYQEPFKQTVTALMSITVWSLYSPEAFSLSQYSCWKRNLPLGLLGESWTYTSRTTPQKLLVSHPLSSFRVQQLKSFLEDLVTMGIDKCRNRELFLCPVLFWQRYRSTFPVQDDPVHFERITVSAEDYAD